MNPDPSDPITVAEARERIGPQLDARWSALLDLWESLTASAHPVTMDSAAIRQLDETITDLGKAIATAQNAAGCTPWPAHAMTFEQMRARWTPQECAMIDTLVRGNVSITEFDGARGSIPSSGANVSTAQLDDARDYECNCSPVISDAFAQGQAPYAQDQLARMGCFPMPTVGSSRVQTPRLVITDQRIVVTVNLQRENVPALLRVIFELNRTPIVEEYRGANGTGDPIWLPYREPAIEALAISCAVADRAQLFRDGTADTLKAAMRLGEFYGKPNGGIQPTAPIAASVHTIHQPE